MISYPTRIADHSATLIDNIFANCINNNISYSSGILVADISDHLPYFLCLKNTISTFKPWRIIYTRKFNDVSFNKFYNGLDSMNMMNQLDQALIIIL